MDLQDMSLHKVQKFTDGVGQTIILLLDLGCCKVSSKVSYPAMPWIIHIL